MNIKICGIFREQDIDSINEARPEYMGFVFAKSKRQVSFKQAAHLRERLAAGIAPVGVFVNAPIQDIITLYRDGVISLAQLHGAEDETYIAALKEQTAQNGLAPIPIIKVIHCSLLTAPSSLLTVPCSLLSDYILLDSGAGSGQPFNWDILASGSPCAEWLKSTGKPWFLAGGINADNIARAMNFNPYCIDVSGGAEMGGIKNREKIVQLVAMTRKGNTA